MQTDQPYHDNNEDESEEALDALGTNVLPFLVQQVFETNTDSDARKHVKDFLDDFPPSWHMPRFVPEEEKSGCAINAIAEIDPRASMVLPLLTNALADTNSSGYHLAIRILADSSNELAVPYLAKAILDQDPDTRAEAILALPRLGPQASPAIPELIELVNRWESTNRNGLHAALTLAEIGSNAMPAIPSLKNRFATNTNIQEQLALASYIYRIDPQERQAFAFLTNHLTSTNGETEVRLSSYFLGTLKSNASPAIPLLLNALRTTNEETWDVVFLELKRVGAASNDIATSVRPSLNSTNDNIREHAARFLLKRDPHDQESKQTLVSLITSQSDSEEDAIRDLGDAGPAAHSAIPTVLAVLSGTNYDCWSAVPTALTNLGVPTSVVLEKLEDKIRPGQIAELPDDYPLIALTGEVLKLDPGNRDAQLTLARFWDDSDVAETLGDANPAIPETKAALRKALDSKNYSTHHAAFESLKKIEAREKDR
jgi:hypothetical protein